MWRSSNRLRARPSEAKYSPTVRSRNCISSDLWCIQVTDKQPGMQMTCCRRWLAVLNQNVGRSKKQFGYFHNHLYRFFKLVICVLVGVIKVDASTTDSPIRWGCTRRLPWWHEGVDWDGCCSCVKVAASDHSTHSGIKSGPAGTMTTGDAGVFLKTHACLYVSYDENSSKSHTE